MECPAYIKEALRKRAIYADKVSTLDGIISEWIEKHEIEVDYEDIHGGVEIYVNPYDSSERVLEAIKNKTK
jgi:hypothetical protein